jgi:group I intron endonuclease
VCGIYKITNQKTGECYIGQSTNIRKRWYEHGRCGVGVDVPQGNQLYKAMLEDGLENFSFELIEECSPQELNQKEQYFISFYSSDTLGYNLNKGTSNGKRNYY